MAHNDVNFEPIGQSRKLISNRVMPVGGLGPKDLMSFPDIKSFKLAEKLTGLGFTL
jgi:hypothetical protein